jgi:hypothetical protein
MAMSRMYQEMLLQARVKIGEEIWIISHEEESLNSGRFAKRRRHNKAQASFFSSPLAGFEAQVVQHLKHEMTDYSSRRD